MPLASAALLLPLLAFGGLWFFNLSLRSSFREAFLRASLIYGAWLVLTLELLSIGHHLKKGPLMGSWAVLIFLLLVLLWRKGLFAQRQYPGPAWAPALARLQQNKISTALLGVAVLWFGTLALIAIVAAPGNIDSMTYHLPRVMQWMQNSSIAFYPTSILRQNHAGPFAEWNILNLALLSGNDRFFNLVQWSFFVGSCMAASLITRILGAGRIGQILTGAIAATTPMAILQSTSTQNDLCAAYFLLCFIYFGFLFSDVARDEKARRVDSVFCGLALGLGLLTKSTNYLFALPFVLLFAWRAIHGAGARSILHGGLLTVCMAAMLAGHSLRLHRSYHQWLGPDGEVFNRAGGNVLAFKYKNEEMNGPRFLYAMVRNLGVHALSIGTPELTGRLAVKVRDTAKNLGLPADDPATTWPGTSFDADTQKHEDLSGNFPQIILFALVWIGLFFVKPSSRLRLGVYGICLIAAFCLFVFMLRWNPWISRIHLPWFMAMSPFCGAVIDGMAIPGLAAAVCGALAFYAWPYVLVNSSRPLLGKKTVLNHSREAQYFIQSSRWREPYRGAVAFLKRENCSSIGLQTEVNDIQYPLWPLTKNAGIKDAVIFQVNVTNQSNEIPCDRIPDAVVVTYPLDESPLSVNGVSYHKAWQQNHVSVFLKD